MEIPAELVSRFAVDVRDGWTHLALEGIHGSEGLDPERCRELDCLPIYARIKGDVARTVAERVGQLEGPDEAR